MLNLPLKNLKRWIKNGPVRKKGGRKTQDPDLERFLLRWIEGYRKEYGTLPNSKEIRDKAIENTKHKESFKASKGWLEKFMSRHFSKEGAWESEGPKEEEGLNGELSDKEDLKQVLERKMVEEHEELLEEKSEVKLESMNELSERQRELDES